VTRIIRAAELIGRAVITLDTATAVAEIRDVLFDPERSRVIGFTLRGRGLLSPPLLGILPTEWVRSIGRDAVMIQSATSVVSDREGMAAAVGEQQEVVGKEVVTDAGVSLGEVSDIVLELDGGTATVVGYEVERAGRPQLIIPADGRVQMSVEAIVLPAEAEQRAVTGLGAFRAGLERERRARERATRKATA
jgi:uncharacterized protein YrrD